MSDSDRVTPLTVVLTPGPDPVKQEAVLAILREQGVRVLVAGTPDAAHELASLADAAKAAAERSGAAADDSLDAVEASNRRIADMQASGAPSMSLADALAQDGPPDDFELDPPRFGELDARLRELGVVPFKKGQPVTPEMIQALQDALDAEDAELASRVRGRLGEVPLAIEKDIDDL
jgi:hypothetical protein